jgi:hypothetical protein
MIRDEDVSGVSGVGRVAEVVVFENGKVVVAWLRGPHTVTVFDSLADVDRVHGHDGLTWLERDTSAEAPREPAPIPDGATFRGARQFGRRV